jgi:mycothiol synthase
VAAGGTRIEQVAALSPSQTAEVLALRDQVAAAERISPLSDHVVAALRSEATGTHLLQYDGDRLVGYATVEGDDDPVAELLAVAAYDVSSLVDAVVAAAGSGVRVWTRGDRSGLGSRLAERGWQPVRVLLQLRRALGQPPLAEPAWPPGVRVRTFVVGADEQAWLTVNNAAFAGHPDQSGWTLADIAAREREPWFDPSGFFLAERDGEIVGFHWTKVHPAGPAEAIGEVYVIGVAPQMQGQRLGEALLLHGLRHLHDLGLAAVKLYTDDTNVAASALYERMAFTRWDSDRCYRLVR